MKKLANTKENNARVKALRTVSNTKWSGTTIHNNMDKCLTGINLFCGVNSGHYNPSAIKINGITGYYMINQDGSILCEARVIKESDNLYKIEYMTKEGWNEFENLYCQILEEN